MRYRKMPGTADELSLLGYGGMRFPITGDGKIDRGKSEAILLKAAELGINYFDTAYVYHEGESESFMGEVFERNGLRGKINIATKQPSWLMNTPDDMDRVLDEQLARLRTDRIDYYLLHGMNEERWPVMRKLDAAGFLARAKADGRIRRAGFSFHDSVRLFFRILGEGDWDFCQIQYNIIDTRFQAGLSGLEEAYRRGLGVVIMEPLHGGLLAKPFPEHIASRAADAGITASPAALALRWLWEQEPVGTVLSGMTEMEDLLENAAAASADDAESLSLVERLAAESWGEWLISRRGAQCTACRYCMPCPQGVNIPRAFQFYNEAVLGDVESARAMMARFTKPHEHAKNCGGCGKCEPLCPQGIPIAETLKDVSRVLGEHPDSDATS